MKSLLCVDPQAESRAALEVALVEHELVFAETAFEALGQLNSRGFHGYVLDYWLPDLAGPTLCREIRKLDPYAPIMFYTPATRPEDRARALRAGASAFLTKPADVMELKARLRTALWASEVENAKAKVDEEQAIQEELERRAAHARQRAANASGLAAASLERTARIRAFKAFMQARGTRAHFESWWPEVYESAHHRYGKLRDSDVQDVDA
jgi:DNA-binding response OmpR family regulator